MARILIGNIKGPKGDTGPQGKQGPTGPQGPKGDTGPMPALINNASTTSAGVGALDAAMGKTLGDRIDVLNNNTLSYESNNSDIKMFCATSVNGGFFEADVNTNEKYQLLFQTTQKKILARYFNGEQWNDQVVASWS